MESICLLGASGSIGTQTLDVINKNNRDFKLVSFSVGHRINKIPHILKKFPSVRAVCVQEEKDFLILRQKYPNLKFYFGDKGLTDLIDAYPVTMIVNALVGFAGLYPTIYSLKKKLAVALANKESLVVGGELINDLLSKNYGKLYPIDSEHNALWKCLKVDSENVESLYLTASGGAFRNLTREELINVTPSDALKHPTWKMGAKITIDCATLVNKAFEVIEAHYLYNYPESKIKIILHQESFVHSYVQYTNGFIRADISHPNMRNPIKFALYRGTIPFKTYYLKSIDSLPRYHFLPFNINRYPILQYAKKVINEKGACGAIFNAANEVAVQAFLKGEISFLDIEYVIERCFKEIPNQKCSSFEKLQQIDTFSRQFALKIIKERKQK